MKFYLSIIVFALSITSCIGQSGTFTLANGIEITGKVHGYSRDSITLITPEGKFVTFAMNEISQNNARHSPKKNFDPKAKKLFFQTSIGLGFSGSLEAFFTGVRLEFEGLYKAIPTQYGFFTGQTGYELIQAAYPTSFVPLTIGYQGPIAKWPGNEIHWNARVGYGVALNDKSPYDWEQRDIDGGMRYELGIAMLPALSGNTAFRLGASILFQKAEYHIESDWSRQDIHQTFKRLFIHAGIVF